MRLIDQDLALGMSLKIGYVTGPGNEPQLRSGNEFKTCI